MTKQVLSNLKSLPYGGAQYVVSQNMEQAVSVAIAQAANNGCLLNASIHMDFCRNYLEWIQTTQLNQWSGLDQFSVASFSNGTTESFDKFYLKNIKRRLRFLRGEYMYHQVAGRKYFGEVSFLEDEPLRTGDAVVISLPFSDTGGAHPLMLTVLQQCTDLRIPVLLDCSYFGICTGIEFDLNYTCITDVTLSLSKCFPVPNLRIGMRLTRTDDDDLLLVMNKTNYVNRLSCSVGLDLMRLYSADYVWKTYNLAQREICARLQVSLSDCVIFGIDEHNRYPEYNRGGVTNRLCLSKYLESQNNATLPGLVQ